MRWYQGQADSLGMTGIIVVTQVSPTAVTLFGDDVHMPQYMQQITGYN